MATDWMWEQMYEMEPEFERWQQQDEEREYLRRVELVKQAIEAGRYEAWFSPEDIEDLKYFLRVKEFFQ